LISFLGSSVGRAVDC